MLAVMVFVAATTVAGNRTRGDWVETTVDSQPASGFGTGLAVQPGGQVHISYQGDNGHLLRYATNAYGWSPWTSQAVDSSSDSSVGRKSALAVDSAGNMHIVYSDSYHRTIMYATNTGGPWTRVDLEEPNGGENSALAIDAANRAHILTVSNLGAVHYKTNVVGSGDTWTTTTLETGSDNHQYVQIAVDDTRHVHALYCVGNNLHYATNAGGGWATKTVEANVFIDTPLALHLDAAGNAYAAYLDQVSHTVRYATQAADGSAWTAEKIEDAPNPEAMIARITTDPDGNPTVHYFIRSQNRLIRAARDAHGVWQVTPLRDLGDVEDVALAVDRAGHLHAVYAKKPAGPLVHLTDGDNPRGADLQVTQTRAPETILIGQPVQYTITVTNLGADDATGVRLEDTLPAGAVFVSATGGAAPDPQHPETIVWDIGTLARGAVATTTITVTAPIGAQYLSLTNSVSVTSSSGDFRSANDLASLEDPLVRPMRSLLMQVAGDVGGRLAASNGQSSFEEGTEVTVIASPDPGYRVKAWQGTLDDTSTATVNTVRIGPGDKTTVGVEFEKIPRQLATQVVGGNGTLSANPVGGTYPDGTYVTLVAAPSRHYRVRQWIGTDNDQSVSTVNSVILHADRTVSVEFEPAPNQVPVAVITNAPSTCRPGDVVTLDGSSSYDPDGDPLTYKWLLSDKTIFLTDSTSAVTTFQAPTQVKDELMLNIRLEVNDGSVAGDTYAIIKIKRSAAPVGLGGCGKGLGAGNLAGFAAACWLGLVCMKWGPRRRRKI